VSEVKVQSFIFSALYPSKSGLLEYTNISCNAESAFLKHIVFGFRDLL